MLASLLRRSQLPGENENGNWPVCKAPVTLELGDVNPRHFLQCKTCRRPVLRRGALILIDHQQNRQRPPPPPLLLSLSLAFFLCSSESITEWKRRRTTVFATAGQIRPAFRRRQ
jgi:hypothetical protein